MKIPTALIIAAFAIGVGAIVTVFVIPEFKNWVFLVLLVAFGLGAAGVVLRAQPPK